MQSRPIADLMLAVPRGWIVLALAAAGWLAVALLWRALQTVLLLIG